uniref:Uncharacterized protein n=1 Tax=Tanacetum cinerariifolium TaxID=118510 RepID=A0A6L2KDE7_TANCI|nr:hypothetical protein [Tanacetum cinerariifolium]
MANLLPRLQELETAANFKVMVDQVLVLMEREIDKELKLKQKFRDICSEMAGMVKNWAEHIEELARYPWLRDNIECVEACAKE